MGIDCSNCRCTNKDDEKILIIDNMSEKMTTSKIESRKEKLKTIEKLKSSNNRINLNELLVSFPDLNNNITKLQSFIRKHRDRKIYKAIVKKFRVSL